MADAATDYGTLAPLVKTVGWLMSSAIAIGFSWRGRANWEPSEQDIPQAPARVSGVLTAVLVALIWTQMANEESSNSLIALMGWLSLALVSFLLFYTFITSAMVFEQKYSPADNEIAVRRVIGGFRFTPQAREVKKQRKLTTKKIFAGAAYDVDEVWTSGSRALAKVFFVICYIGLTVCGSIALTCAAILLLLQKNE